MGEEGSGAQRRANEEDDKNRWDACLHTSSSRNSDSTAIATTTTTRREREREREEHAQLEEQSNSPNKNTKRDGTAAVDGPSLML
jgi:hypothetical protein